MHDLNPRQREAVGHVDSPLLVLAGAGSGKTRVITYKIAHLIRERGLSPDRIAAVTFTNKAAREMKKRVTGLLGGEEIAGLRVSTFHTLGLNILRREHLRLGYRRGISIFDAADSLSLLKEQMKRTGEDRATEAAQWKISAWKSALVDPEAALKGAGDELDADAARLYAVYQRALKAYNGVDFDDLIAQPVALFRDFPDALEAWRERIRYLLADEYQDTNLAQYELMRLLAGEEGRFTVVGDDDQSIYTWRGANPDNLRQLADDYPALTVVKLEQNYRSSGNILGAANTLIDNNPHLFAKSLWSAHGPGDLLRVVPCKDETDEAERIVVDLSGKRMRGQGEFRDFAILFRGNHQARLFEQSLRSFGVPYRLSGGRSFFDRSEVRDAMAYLRLAANVDDDTAFLRIVNVPRRQIGTTTLERLAEFAHARQVSLFAAIFEPGASDALPRKGYDALERFGRLIVEAGDDAERGDPVAAARDLIADAGYEDWLDQDSRDPRHAEIRCENVGALFDWLLRVAKSNPKDGLGELLNQLALLDRLDNEDNESGNEVSLMTLHAAKGLEFDNVYLAGMEEGLLPHHHNLEGAGLEEERRLAYVGITRARKRLILTYAQQRRRHGETRDTEPSRFLEELPRDGYEWDEEHRARRDPEEQRQTGAAALASMRALLSD